MGISYVIYALYMRDMIASPGARPRSVYHSINKKSVCVCVCV